MSGWKKLSPPTGCWPVSLMVPYAVALVKSIRGARDEVVFNRFLINDTSGCGGWGGCQKNINRLVSLVIDR